MINPFVGVSLKDMYFMRKMKALACSHLRGVSRGSVLLGEVVANLSHELADKAEWGQLDGGVVGGASVDLDGVHSESP